MSYRLGIDLGTTYTAAAVATGNGEPAMIGLGNRAMQIPSVLFLGADDRFVIGETAERRAAVDPVRVVREFKRRFGDTVPIRVAGRPYGAHELLTVLLRAVVELAAQRQGEPPESVTLTHPANWGPYKLDLFREVASLAGLENVRFCPEPVAAAIQYASKSRVRPGDRLAVYDLGGGTFDVCILTTAAAGFELLGKPRGIDRLGGTDFDDVVLGVVAGTLDQRGTPLDPDDPELEGLDRLRRDCVDAKEALSAEPDATVRVSLSGSETVVRITRREFESAIRPRLESTLEATRLALRSAGVDAADLTAVVLIGGSSRIPLVAEMLQHEFAIPLGLDTHPKHDVALGAARLGAPPPAAPPAPSPLVARRHGSAAAEDAEFGAAVDLQAAGRWAEAEVLFARLAVRYPTDHGVLDRLGAVRRKLAQQLTPPAPGLSPDERPAAHPAPSREAPSDDRPAAPVTPAPADQAKGADRQPSADLRHGGERRLDRIRGTRSQTQSSESSAIETPAELLNPKGHPGWGRAGAEPRKSRTRRAVTVAVALCAGVTLVIAVTSQVVKHDSKPPAAEGSAILTPAPQRALAAPKITAARSGSGNSVVFSWPHYIGEQPSDTYLLRWNPTGVGPATTRKRSYQVTTRQRVCLSVEVRSADGLTTKFDDATKCVDPG